MTRSLDTRTGPQHLTAGQNPRCSTVSYRAGLWLFTLGLATSLLFSCSSGPQPQLADNQAEPPREAAPVSFAPAAAGQVEEESPDELLRDVQLRGEERQAASKAALQEAERLAAELRYQDAERKLEEAIRLDPNNEAARERLQEILFILGDARTDAGMLQRDLIERRKIDRQQSVLEMRRMFMEGQNFAREGEYERAIRIYNQLLERIYWFPYNVDLTELKTSTERAKEEADRLAQEQAAAERAELERLSDEDAQTERERSLKFIQTRVKRLSQRLDQAFEDRRYEDSIELAEKIIELDPKNMKAKRLLRKSRTLRHLYSRMKLADRHRDEWDRSMLSSLESEIPYTRIFNFPDSDEWEQIRKKSLDVRERLIGKETTEESEIALRLRQPISVEFDGTDFGAVIDFFREATGLNFVLTKEAEESIADNDEPVNLARIEGLPTESALRLVLDGREPRFSYVIRNNAIVVGPSESLRDDLLIAFYEVFDLTRRRPDYPAPSLALDESEGGDGGLGGTSSIIDLGDDEDEAGTVFDGEVLAEEILSPAIFGEDGPEDPESIAYEGGKLVARTTLENHQKIQEILAQLRRSTGVMVTVESRFLDLQDNFLESIGIDFGNPTSSNLPNPISDIDGNGTQLQPGYEFVDAQEQTNVRGAVYNAFSQPLGSQVAPFELSEAGGLALQYNVLDNYILEAILRAVAKTQNFTQVQAPRVTAFNGQISHSLVIEQSAYIKDAEVNQTGVVPVINPVIGILNSGSILQVKPTVSHDRKYVILEIEPTLAVQLPSRFKLLTLNLTTLNVEFPVLNVTKIKTTVTCPDGGTVLVGGLKRTITQEQSIGTPWTRSLPGLNLLFGRKGQTRLQSNLYVLLNAKITVIRDEEEELFN